MAVLLRLMRCFCFCFICVVGIMSLLLLMMLLLLSHQQGKQTPTCFVVQIVQHAPDHAASEAALDVSALYF